MEATALLSDPKPMQHAGTVEPSLHTFEFVAGQEIRVTAGHLAGIHGVIHRQAADGRCLIELCDMVPGVFLCIDPGQICARD